MKIHQIRWEGTDTTVLNFNTLSCFNCCGNCELYHLCQVVYRETEGLASDTEDETGLLREFAALIPDPEILRIPQFPKLQMCLFPKLLVFL